MFNITHTAKPGVCKARRCTKPDVSDGLCEKHFAEWSEAGKPPFGETGSAVTAANLVTYGTRMELAEEKVSVQRSLELVTEVQITDQATMDWAGKALEGVRDSREKLLKKQAAELKPIKDSLEATKAMFAPVDALYAQCEAVLRDKMNAHVRMQQQLQDQARLAVEAAGGQVDEHTLVVAHGIENVALPVGVGLRETWGYEVTDETALRRAVALGEIVGAAVVNVDKLTEAEQAHLRDLLGEVMRMLGVSNAAKSEYLAINQKALATAARELKADADIPGVKVAVTAAITAPRRNGKHS